MTPAHAATAGALIGLMLGIAICLIQAIPIADALLRIAILTFVGAWMGLLLAWLNQLLPNKQDNNKEHRDTGI